MKRSASMAVLIFVASSMFAADPARFSGTWKENMEKSTKSKVTSYVSKVDAAADSVKVTTTTNGPRGERTAERTYTIGKEVAAKMSDGDEAIFNAKWEGDALVIVSTVKEPDGTVENKETWTLSADGKTLTKQRHVHSAKGDRDETHVLERQ
jgi:hypothetical protein